jgi:phosphonate transport system substrate-binding protein
VAAAFAEMHLDAKGLETLTQASQQVGLNREAHFITSNGSEYDAYRRFYQAAPAALR